MKLQEIMNATIIGTSLGVEDHGIFTCNLHLSGDGWGCGFGGYALDQWTDKQKRRIGTAYGMQFIARILETLEVDSWEKLKGQHVRVVTDGVGGRIQSIGHFLKDKWFDPKEFKEMPA